MSKVLRIPLGQALEHLGIPSMTENEGLMDYAAEASDGFLKEWAAETEGMDEPTEGSVHVGGYWIPEEVQQAVQDKVWDNVGRSSFRTEMAAFVNALADLGVESARVVGVRDAIAVTEGGGDVRFTISRDFMRIWKAATEGVGYSSWDPDLRLKDVTAKTVLHVLDSMTEVYGWSSIKRRMESDLERFEPDTGSYWELKKVAEAAMPKAAAVGGALGGLETHVSEILEGAGFDSYDFWWSNGLHVASPEVGQEIVKVLRENGLRSVQHGTKIEFVPS